MGQIPFEIMSYKIEPGVPVPAKLRTSKYPFPSMMVGDSFLAPLGQATPKKIASAAYCWSKSRKNDFKFAVRGCPDGTRCWRVA